MSVVLSDATKAKFQKLHECALRFAVPILLGQMTYAECYEHLCRGVAQHPDGKKLLVDSAKFDRVCHWLMDEMTGAVERPILSKSQEVRDAMRPMLQARRHRDSVMLQAYRVAGDVLTSAEVENIILQEVERYRLETGAVAVAA